MTIKGLTDVGASFPRLGILRKGDAKPANSDRPGKDLSYFRFVTEDPDAKRLFHEIYGPEPRVIRVILPFATRAENYEAWMEEYGAGSIKHRCDNDGNCVLWQDDQGEYHTTPKACPGGCKPNGRLQVIIPALKRLAYVMVLTTAWNDCGELDRNLAAAENAARVMDRDLRGIPFNLKRVEREVSTPPTAQTGGKRVRRKKWLLHLEPAPEWVALQIEAAQQLAMPALPGEIINEDNGDPETERGDTVDSETGEIINGTAEVVPPQPPPGPASNGDKQEPRPFAPQRLGHIMGIKIERREETGPISANQLALVAGKLNEVWAGDAEADNNRRSVLKYLFAVDSAKDLTRAQAAVVLDWLIEGKDETGDYPLKPMAEKEAKLIVRQYVEDAGQLTMEIGEEAE